MLIAILKILGIIMLIGFSLFLIFICPGAREDEKYRAKLMMEKYGFYDENLQNHEHKEIYGEMKKREEENDNEN